MFKYRLLTKIYMRIFFKQEKKFFPIKKNERSDSNNE